MLSDENLLNSVLYRPKSKTGREPFLVPIKSSLSTLKIYQNQNHHQTNLHRSASSSNFLKVNNNNASAAGAANMLTSPGSAVSRRSIRILRPETIKRAITDASMAASIGDLEWLKQTFKIVSEMPYDKNGFMTIHLASIHGRLNILKYLIEERKIDANLPSTHGWRPVHLCISSQIGERAIECLRYLIQQGGDIEVKNDDGVYPIHMAASEGQIECLKLLLDLKADTNVTDCRGQSPVDLAKLWGHRLCAKLLNKDLWHQRKELIHQHHLLEKRIKTQDILREIEEAHMSYYDDKKMSEQVFDKWLVEQGFFPEENNDQQLQQQQQHLSNKSSGADYQELNIKSSSKKINQATTTTTTTTVAASSSPAQSSTPYISISNLNNNQEQRTTAASSTTSPQLNKDSKIRLTQSYDVIKQKPGGTVGRSGGGDKWNYSTKPDEKVYTTNLNDFYPRDPYTCLPKNVDLVAINRELKGMSLEQVKKFIRKQLPRENIKYLNHRDERPDVLYKPVNIIDAQTKAGKENLGDETRIHDEMGLMLYNEPKNFQFREVKRFIAEKNPSAVRASSLGHYFNTNSTLKKIKKQLLTDHDENLAIIRRKYGSDLSEFMKDKRKGKLSQKYEKVFIC